ncbi:hypothetical protein V2G26_007284 [Clonostachys chloroleuca]|uniref:Uncharacterized protein n=2 Tax=Bionectria ochroleuca TaxID=29856 RepID=A0A0B7KSF0_BIOOC|nr:unnamed protein product [Clonostachys rosea f. rosea IK726]
MVVKYHSGLAVLLAFSSAVLAQITTPCTYQEYLCGSTLLTNGYAVADLRTAYDANLNSPVIPDTALNKVLFRCTDNVGAIVGNSYCIVGCGVVGDNLVDDMCTM